MKNLNRSIRDYILEGETFLNSMDKYFLNGRLSIFAGNRDSNNIIAKMINHNMNV